MPNPPPSSARRPKRKQGSEEEKRHVLLRHNAYNDKELIELYLEQKDGISHIGHDPVLLKKLQRKLGLLGALAEMIQVERRARLFAEDNVKQLKNEWKAIKEFLRANDKS